MRLAKLAIGGCAAAPSWPAATRSRTRISTVIMGGTFFAGPVPYYYPYVQYCPGGWQLVMPAPGTY